MLKREEISMEIDFRWIFAGGEEPCEDDRKYKIFLKKMYKSGTNTFLLLGKEEEELLRNYKL